MAQVILTNVKLCTGTQGAPREYVPNTGRIASVSDRVDLRVDSNTLERRAEAVELNRERVGKDPTVGLSLITLNTTWRKSATICLKSRGSTDSLPVGGMI
jgi:hypothetical protein